MLATPHVRKAAHRGLSFAFAARAAAFCVAFAPALAAADESAWAHTLAEIRRAQQRFAEAEALYRRALGIRERAFGREHPETVASRVALFALYRGQGRRAEAEALFR